MFRRYFKKSWQITRTNPVAYIGATILFVIFSFLTLFLLFPTLITGIEGMYLRAREGKKVRASDIFMYRRKFFSLLGASLLIALDVAFTLLLFTVPLVLFFYIAFVVMSPPIPLGGPVIIVSCALWSIGYVLFTLRREGRYLHALNFIAERGSQITEGLKKSRIAVKNRWKAAGIAALYLGTWPMPFSLISGEGPLELRIGLTILGLFLVPLVLGTTAIAFAHETGFEVEHEGDQR